MDKRSTSPNLDNIQTETSSRASTPTCSRCALIWTSKAQKLADVICRGAWYPGSPFFRIACLLQRANFPLTHNRHPSPTSIIKPRLVLRRNRQDPRSFESNRSFQNVPPKHHSSVVRGTYNTRLTNAIKTP